VTVATNLRITCEYRLNVGFRLKHAAAIASPAIPHPQWRQDLNHFESWRLPGCDTKKCLGIFFANQQSLSAIPLPIYDDHRNIIFLTEAL
jgi:hypothetical protein